MLSSWLINVWLALWINRTLFQTDEMSVWWLEQHHRGGWYQNYKLSSATWAKRLYLPLGFSTFSTIMRLLVCFSLLSNEIWKDSLGPWGPEAIRILSLSPGPTAWPPPHWGSPTWAPLWAPISAHHAPMPWDSWWRHSLHWGQPGLPPCSPSQSSPDRRSRVKCYFVHYLCKLYWFCSKTEKML